MYYIILSASMMLSVNETVEGWEHRLHTLMVLPSILGGCCSLATCSEGSIAMTSSCAYAIMSGSHAAHSRPNHAGLSLPPPAGWCMTCQCMLCYWMMLYGTICQPS